MQNDLFSIDSNLHEPAKSADVCPISHKLFLTVLFIEYPVPKKSCFTGPIDQDFQLYPFLFFKLYLYISGR